ncbi:hypothetical protein BDV98DRAFT_511234, partial [Pterulicium gracile]
ECQLADWSAHKAGCAPWYDKHRKCDDRSEHFGKLELIIWTGVDDGDKLGFGCVYEDEADDLKHRFETEFNSDLEKFFEERPMGYRWTCYGMVGDMTYGCDHHGTGPKPCTCDYCRGGKRLPNHIYNDPHPSRKGLKLPRGPDPRYARPYFVAVVALMTVCL